MIRIKNLHFSYRSKKVLDGLDLQLSPGHIYGLLGKNGAGKSTLLRNLAGLLFPVEGSIDVMGHDPSHRSPAFLQDVFIVPEEFYLPNLPVKKFVQYNAPFYPKFNHAGFEQYLKEFEIPVTDSLQNMSYGQKKKVLISFGLACNTALLLMDEPTNGLDITSKSQFRKVMAARIDDNKCIIVSTHQVKDLESLIDRITVIEEGKILFDQDVDSISRRLSFKISYDSMETAAALYSESSLKGNSIITYNTNEEESRPDLEMLYKAILNNQSAIQNVFNQ